MRGVLHLALQLESLRIPGFRILWSGLLGIGRDHPNLARRANSKSKTGRGRPERLRKWLIIKDLFCHPPVFRPDLSGLKKK